MTALTNHTRWFLLLLFTVACGVLLAVFHQYPISTTIVVTETLSGALLLTGTVWTGMVIVKAYPTKVGILVYALLIGLVCGLAAWYADRLFLNWWFDGEQEYISWLKPTQLPRLIVALAINVWLITLSAINQRSSELEQQFKHISDATTLHREAELFKLRQQLQPHFLYNSLNSISALILIQPDKAQEMIGRLSDFLRNSVKRDARDLIPVHEELDYIEAYLSIESVRFGDRLSVAYEKEFTDGAVVPPFLLQPILENAIKFGLYGTTGQVNIKIRISLKAGYLTITITNPYDAANKPPSGTGFGLEGIQRRLYLLFGRTDLLETRNEADLFTTILKIPQSDVQGDTD